MTSDHAGRNAQPAVPGRLRRWLGLGTDPPLPRPRVVHLRPVRRSWPMAVWQARAAVLSRTSLDAYLRARLARYWAELAVPEARLPLRVEVVAGEIIAKQAAFSPAEPAPAPAKPAADAWAPLTSLDGPSVLREAPELRARLTELDARRATARRHVQDLSERLADDVIGGKLPPAAEPEETAEQLGRPRVRGRGTEVGLLGLAAVTLLAQTWVVAVPVLMAAGRYPMALTREIRPETVDAFLICAFALGVSVGLLALAMVSVRAAEAFIRDLGPAGRRRAHAAGIVAAMLGTAAAVAAATLPAPRSGFPPAIYSLLLLSVSAGIALVLRRASRARQAREGELAAALAWDRARAQTLGERARRMEELVRVEASLREVDARGEQARARLEELERRAAEATRLVAQVEQLERAELSRLARSLIGALERDRYEFLRQAAARGATDLLSGSWVPKAEPRPPAEASPGRETGRMAG